MISKIKISSIALFLSIFAVFISYGEQKAEWRGKIEYKDGVTVIKNPKEPIYSEDIFSLEEELLIRESDAKNYIFVKLAQLLLDENNNIYVLDSREANIKIIIYMEMMKARSLHLLDIN